MAETEAGSIYRPGALALAALPKRTASATAKYVAWKPAMGAFGFGGRRVTAMSLLSGKCAYWEYSYVTA